MRGYQNYDYVLSVAKSECNKKDIEDWIRNHQTN